MDGYKVVYSRRTTDSIEHVLRASMTSSEAKTLLGMITVDQGDTISGNEHD